MALFHYKAVSARGKSLSGVIDADSFAVAKERLRKQQILVTHLEGHKEEREKIALTPALLLSFTREIGQLLRAGLPLYESLLTIEEKYRRHKAHPLFLDLCDRMKSGHSLSSVLKEYPRSFDLVYLSMIAAAEESASLPGAFEQLSLLIAKQQKLKKQLISATAYPAFLAGFCLFVVCGLLFFVIPSMQELFEGRRLHPLTALVLGASRFATGHASLLAALIASCVLAFLLSLRLENLRAARQRLLLKVPLLSTLMIQTSIIRFCRTLSLLLASSVPLLKALAHARKVMKNPLLEKEILLLEQKVGEGQKMSAQLKDSPLMPPLLIRMLALAEETGKFDTSLSSAADLLEEDVERHLTQLTALLQPLLLLLIGGIVGLVVLSIMLPLTDVSSFLSP